MKPKRLTHIDASGRSRMVDVSAKAPSRRSAKARGVVQVAPETVHQLETLGLPKGDPLEVARIAGIQAAKETSRLIPFCHSLHLDFVDIQIELSSDRFEIRSEVVCRRATGVEMEALTAVAVAALTIYDMCKAVDKSMQIGPIELIEKTKEPVE